MSLSIRWNRLSRLNRTRISVCLFLLTVLAAMSSVPLLLINGSL